MKLTALLTTTALLVSLVPVVAQAQDANLFARDRNVAVTQRGRPELEALGIRVGTLMLYPKLQADIGHDSNVLASESGEVSDGFAKLTPSVDLESDWSRHALRGSAESTFTRYDELSNENSETWRLNTSGRIDVQRETQITGGGEIARLVEPRTSSNTPQAIADPIEYDARSFNAGVSHTFNRLRATGRLDVREFDYEDGRSIGGAVVDQDDRDQTTYEGLARIDYAISPATALFGRVLWNDRRFDDPGTALTPNRDSSGINAIVGANFELSNLVRGEVGVGYLQQDFDHPLYGEFSGLSANAQVEYFLSPLLTLGLSGNRSVADSGIIGTAGILNTTVQVTADYEFRRNIIVGARLGVAVEEFDAIDRENTRTFGGVRATYLMNRRFGVTATYDFETRESEGVNAINDFTANRVLLSLVAQY